LQKYIKILFVGTFLTLISCGTQKGVATAAVEDLKTTELVKNVLAQNPKFTHLTISSKINADIDDVAVGLNGKIYVQNGKKIWVNITKFGVTGARALITPEGLKAYEKLDRTYIDGDFTYFNNLLKVDFIDYQKLQNLLLGRIFVDLKASEFQSEIVDNQYVLRFKENESILQTPIEGKYYQEYFFDSNFNMTKAVVIEPKSKRELEINYSGWQKVGTQVFPKSVKVLVKDTKTQKVDLEYNNFTFEQSETPFEIPSGYKPNKLLK
jgi:hypothetical protein